MRANSLYPLRPQLPTNRRCASRVPRHQKTTLRLTLDVHKNAVTQNKHLIAPLEAFCTRHELPWNVQASERFLLFIDLLVRLRKAMNLIGPMSPEDIVQELLIDSIAAAALIPPKGRVLDVGSGAGFPGIPLAILYPQIDFMLVEPRQKRTTFLDIATHRLGLEHVHVEICRIEDLHHTSPFDIVISKAFQPPLEWVNTASTYTAPGGHIICMTREDEVATLTADAHRRAWTKPTTLRSFHDVQSDARARLNDRVVLAMRTPAERQA